MYAVIATGGKQYRVSEGDKIRVEKLNAEAGAAVTLDKVLVVGGEGETVVGAPYIEGACVAAEVVENGKADKVIIFKYKAKKDYRKKQGHRQPYTMVQITGIGTDKPAEAPVAEEAPAKSLKSMLKAELIDYAKENNIEIDEKATKAAILEAIEAAN